MTIEEKLLFKNSTLLDVLERFGDSNIHHGNLADDMYVYLAKHFQNTKGDIKIREINNASDYVSKKIIENYFLIKKDEKV